MEVPSIGRTGRDVSRIGLGLAALGRPGYINLGHAADLQGDLAVPAMEARAHAVLDAAYAAGVRYFDAARSYGLAEAFLASWLRARKLEPTEVNVGSKWGYTYTGGWKTQAAQHEVKDHSLASLRRQLQESREILGPYLGLYQIHSATLESGVLADRAVHSGLADLKAEGCRIGLSASGPRQAEVLRRALEVEVDGQRLFDCVQATWNILEPSAGTALEEAHAAGLAVIVKEALANGRLSDRNQDPSFAETRRLLEALAASRGASLDGLALAAVLDRPWADVVLSGASTVDQLGSNLSALAVEWNDELRGRTARFAESPETYWKTRARLPWN